MVKKINSSVVWKESSFGHFILGILADHPVRRSGFIR